MSSITEFCSDYKYTCIATLGLAVVGYLGYRGVKWLLGKLSNITNLFHKTVNDSNAQNSEGSSSLIGRIKKPKEKSNFPDILPLVEANPLANPLANPQKLEEVDPRNLKKENVPDFERCRGNRWLNDNIIRFAMRLLKEKHGDRFHFLEPSAMYTFLNFPKDREMINSVFGEIRRLCASKKLKYVALPFNPGGNHWTIAFINPFSNTVDYYDSLRWRISDKACSFFKMTLNQMNKITNPKNDPKVRKWQLKIMTRPGTENQQPGGSNCGVYIIALMDMLLSNGQGKLAYQDGGQGDPATVQFRFAEWRKSLYRDLNKYFYKDYSGHGAFNVGRRDLELEEGNLFT